MKEESKEIIRNADHQVFATNQAPGHLEYAGRLIGWHVAPDVQRGDMERCYRLEVRETRSGFQVHNVGFERAVDWTDWRERSREAKSEFFQSRLEAVHYVKDYEWAVSAQQRVNINPDTLGEWRWASPYYQAFAGRGRSSQSQALADTQRFVAEQRGEIEHEI